MGRGGEGGVYQHQQENRCFDSGRVLRLFRDYETLSRRTAKVGDGWNKLRYYQQNSDGSFTFVPGPSGQFQVINSKLFQGVVQNTDYALRPDLDRSMTIQPIVVDINNDGCDGASSSHIFTHTHAHRFLRHPSLLLSLAYNTQARRHHTCNPHPHADILVAGYVEINGNSPRDDQGNLGEPNFHVQPCEIFALKCVKEEVDRESALIKYELDDVYNPFNKIGDTQDKEEYNQCRVAAGDFNGNGETQFVILGGRIAAHLAIRPRLTTGPWEPMENDESRYTYNELDRCDSTNIAEFEDCNIFSNMIPTYTRGVKPLKGTLSGSTPVAYDYDGACVPLPSSFFLGVCVCESCVGVGVGVGVGVDVV